MSKLRLLLLTLILLSGTSALAVHSATSNLQLPSLGEASAGLISPSEEYELGQTLLRRYRGAMPLSDDPFIEEYLSRLLRKIAGYSDLIDKRLELLVLENRSLNAFAAPGGIVGVNTGTFLVTQNEHQLASILAHELAHLSQRHHARRFQQQRTNSIVSLTALLASIMVAASANSDVGIAALPAVQAAAIDRSLRFSRDMELEADRVAMQTMVRAGFDPYGVPELFEIMARSARHRSQVPEFLMTHPVTERRIADSMGRASRHPRRQHSESEEFQFIRARTMLQYESNSDLAVRRFNDELNGRNLSPSAARYGLVMALTQSGRLKEAREQLKLLRESSQHHVAIAIAEADIYAKENKTDEALSILKSMLANRPNSHPLNVRYAELLMAAGHYQLSESVLQTHVKRHPKNAYVWYLLAEVHGLAGNILDVHRARAEYFILRGVYQKAEIQLHNALRLIGDKNFQARARIEQRLVDLSKLQEQS